MVHPLVKGLTHFSIQHPGPARCAGAVVMELLPYNWEWNGISRTYANLTASCGDIHHVAWRAKHPRCDPSTSR